jgi:hypothetical protein
MNSRTIQNSLINLIDFTNTKSINLLNETSVCDLFYTDMQKFLENMTINPSMNKTSPEFQLQIPDIDSQNIGCFNQAKSLNNIFPGTRDEVNPDAGNFNIIVLSDQIHGYPGFQKLLHKIESLNILKVQADETLLLGDCDAVVDFKISVPAFSDSEMTEYEIEATDNFKKFSFAMAFEKNGDKNVTSDALYHDPLLLPVLPLISLIPLNVQNANVDQFQNMIVDPPDSIDHPHGREFNVLGLEEQVNDPEKNATQESVNKNSIISIGSLTTKDLVGLGQQSFSFLLPDEQRGLIADDLIKPPSVSGAIHLSGKHRSYRDDPSALYDYKPLPEPDHPVPPVIPDAETNTPEIEVIENSKHFTINETSVQVPALSPSFLGTSIVQKVDDILLTGSYPVFDVAGLERQLSVPQSDEGPVSEVSVQVKSPSLNGAIHLSGKHRSYRNDPSALYDYKPLPEPDQPAPPVIPDAETNTPEIEVIGNSKHFTINETSVQIPALSPSFLETSIAQKVDDVSSSDLFPMHNSAGLNQHPPVLRVERMLGFEANELVETPSLTPVVNLNENRRTHRNDPFSLHDRELGSDGDQPIPIVMDAGIHKTEFKIIDNSDPLNFGEANIEIGEIASAPIDISTLGQPNIEGVSDQINPKSIMAGENSALAESHIMPGMFRYNLLGNAGKTAFDDVLKPYKKTADTYQIGGGNAFNYLYPESETIVNETNVFRKENYLKNESYQGADSGDDFNFVDMDIPNINSSSNQTNSLPKEDKMYVKKEHTLHEDFKTGENIFLTDRYNSENEQKTLQKRIGPKKGSTNKSHPVVSNGDLNIPDSLLKNIASNFSNQLQTGEYGDRGNDLFTHNLLKNQPNGIAIANHESKKNMDIQQSLGREVVNQIIKKAIIELREGKTELKIQIQPKIMGHIKIQLSSENDQMLAKIMTETLHAKDILEQHMHLLIDELRGQGIDIDNVDVFMTNQNSGNHYSQSEEQRETEKRAKIPYLPDEVHDDSGEKDKNRFFLVPHLTNERNVDYYA